MGKKRDWAKETHNKSSQTLKGKGEVGGVFPRRNTKGSFNARCRIRGALDDEREKTQ